MAKTEAEDSMEEDVSLDLEEVAAICHAQMDSSKQGDPHGRML